MIRVIHKTIVCITALAFTLAFLPKCTKNTEPVIPEMQINVAPGNGSTITEFTCAVEPLEGANNSTVFYYRWDWNSDSTWDTPYSTAKKITHRFRQPGNYTIRVQVSLGKGYGEVFSTTLNIEQGFSSPKPNFTIEPDSGNIYTDFYFNASSTYDDEDSIDQLQFRWDFGADGFYDVPFSTDPTIYRTFGRVGYHTVVMQVKDPSNKYGLIKKDLFIDNIDRDMLPDFTWHADIDEAGEPFNFDASLSSHKVDTSLQFQYSWKFSYFDWTEPSYNPETTHTFISGGNHIVHLMTINPNTALQKTIQKTVTVGEENKAPEPVITAAIEQGNIRTQFYLHTWFSTDDHVGASGLLYRWDFEGDGYWDTNYGPHLEMHHQFTHAGDYRARVEAVDPGGKKAVATLLLTVSPYLNETSYFMDARDRQLYGSVKIGSTWWMAENLNYDVPQKLTTGLYTWICLYEQKSWCEEVGRLYHVSAITHNRGSDEYLDICPPGWRLSEQQEMEDLIANVGGPTNGKTLELGGSQDFNAQYLGYADYYFVIEQMRIVDTVYRFKESYESVYLTSSTIPEDINNMRSDIYMIRLDRQSGEIWNGFNRAGIYVPVRCVKEE